MDDLIAKIRAEIDRDEQLANGEDEQAHNQRHWPDRVLRQVEAFRKILELHACITKTGHCAFFDKQIGIHTTQCWHCPGCVARDWDLDGDNKPCPIVLALADVYGIEHPVPITPNRIDPDTGAVCWGTPKP